MCAWLIQEPIDAEKISTWIEEHQHVLQFDSNSASHQEHCESISGEVLLYASLVPLIEKKLNQRNLWNYYINIEMPAMNVTLQMLLNGVLIDRIELIHHREALLVRHPCHSLTFLIQHVVFSSLDFDESIGIACISSS